MLHVHRAERADGLIGALRDLLLHPLADPFAPEVVAVPTRGMERWLTQRLSGLLGTSPGRADGVCANVAFPSLQRLVGGAVASASGIDPDADPWLPERALWPLLAVVDESLDAPWLRSLATHLGGANGEGARRRLASVRHLAELFDRYALHRPTMVRAWARGDDVDAQGAPLPPDAAWQPELWRRLAARIDAPDPASRLEQACARLRAEPDLAGLPPRLSLFGLTRLPAAQLQVLRALAATADVHLLLLHPSPALWARVAEHPPAVRRADDTTATLARNRLLASWGHDARELQHVVGGDHADHHHPVEHRGTTLLARLQADIRADRPPPGPPRNDEPDRRAPLAPDDRSLQIHACHGRPRQVEVLRDAVLHLLAEDPTLEPRDVIVMCPDIEAFAPLVQATFGAAEPAEGEGDGPDLRVRLADRALRQTNPVLGVVAELLDLAGERLTASQVLDLADREPVRRRFRFDDDELARLQDWVRDGGVRWGLDAAHRAPFRLGSVEAGTWRFGLDRILLGVTMTEDDQRLVAGVLPLDDVESGAIDLAGRLAELVDRLEAALRSFAAPQPIDAWADAIATAADALTATADRDAWQRAELRRLLDGVVGEAGGSTTAIALPELRALLAGRLQGRPTRANFRTGHLTVCTLHPMRSVPHRVVCLLGLDDGAFPRKAPRDGDDVMLDDPHVGDRDPRTEDRQLLLDALLAATERLIVTYTGNDERTNAPRPPAVPVGELLDAVEATAGEDARARVVVRHPLQPFDPRNFAPGALVPDRPWSFDAVTLAGARALTGPRARPGPFLPARLPPLESPVVELEDLVRFVQHPVRAFLRRRLGIGSSEMPDEVADDLPVELAALEKWGVGDRLLAARLAGADNRTAYRAELARGTLPPDRLARPVIDEVLPLVDAIAAAAGPPATDSLDVRVPLPDGRLVTGTVAGVRGGDVRAVTYSRVAAKHRLAAWVRLVALTAAHPGRAFTAVTIGRASSGEGVTVARVGPLAPDVARQHLEALVDLLDRGMREPLPLFCKTSEAYAARRDPRKAWTSEWNIEQEDAEPEHVLVLGGVRAYDELLDIPPLPDECGDGWVEEEATRLGRLAHRLWDGLLASEEVRTA